ncbi:MAG: protein phosphatase 2C domain-containing protein [Defluviitaleaceae bacterium]|nr:protein phosphatase 2C domain-containing protein [Defluviitaleaceae bacterium]
MIYYYGVSLPGTYHAKHGILCQDAHKILPCGKYMAVAAVADGLGSAEYSDIGSKIAVKEAVEYCQKKLIAKATDDQVKEIIRLAFHTAQRAIENEAKTKDHLIEQYDTTLTLAVLIRDTLYYGHSGDSGMIALTTHGRYEAVTQQHRDEEDRVFPLFFTDKWEFGRFSENVSAVMLATDGMLETFFPIYIRNKKENIHVSWAQYFMDNRGLKIDKLGREKVQAGMMDFIEKIPAEKVNDDKTITVLVNTSVKINWKRQPKEYYQEPDWEELKRKHDEAWRRQAYPELYKVWRD